MSKCNRCRGVNVHVRPLRATVSSEELVLEVSQEYEGLNDRKKQYCQDCEQALRYEVRQAFRGWIEGRIAQRHVQGGLMAPDPQQAARIHELETECSRLRKKVARLEHEKSVANSVRDSQASRADRLMAQIAELGDQVDKLKADREGLIDEVAFWQRNHETASEAAKFNRDDANQQKRLRHYWEEQAKVEQRRGAEVPPGWVPEAGAIIMVQDLPGVWRRARTMMATSLLTTVKILDTGRIANFKPEFVRPVTDNGGGP